LVYDNDGGHERDQIRLSIVCFKWEQRERSAFGSSSTTLNAPNIPLNTYICASFVQIRVVQALPVIPSLLHLPMDSKFAQQRKSLTTNKPVLVANPAPGISFNVRPFPPPNLVGVPVEFIVTSLNKFAPHYWAKPQTADCTISTFLFPVFLLP
jgi:hypothetical protein